MPAVLPHLFHLITDHPGASSLLGIAFIVNMREKLPTPFSRFDILNWSYEWLHDSLKTFVSMRGPQPKS